MLRKQKKLTRWYKLKYKLLHNVKVLSTVRMGNQQGIASLAQRLADALKYNIPPSKEKAAGNDPKRRDTKPC